MITGLHLPLRLTTPQRHARATLRILRRALVLFCTLLAAPAPAQSDPPAPAIWRIADADTEIVLFGSIHALPPDLTWRTQAFDLAFDAADIVYLEAPTDYLSATRAAFDLARRGVDPRGARLSDRLSPEGRDRLARVADAVGAPLEAMQTMRPWYAFIALAQAAADHAGFDAAAGVDVVVEAEARRAGKEIRAFETLSGQIGIFADLSPADQVALLEAALGRQESAPTALQDLLAAWRTGDVDALERIAMQDLQSGPSAFFEAIYTRRNLAWAETLNARLDDQPGRLLVVVGAAHLVGPASVQRLLQSQGRKVTRMTVGAPER